MNDELQYFTVDQVATMTGMSELWLYRQCQLRKVPHHRFGRSVRFTREDLRALHQATAVTPEVQELRPAGRGRANAR